MEELRCFHCKEYLSRFPVYIFPGKGNLCGRCPLTDDEDLERNIAYEALAASSLFTCRYIQFGCMEVQTPSSLRIHEEECHFRQYECFMLPKRSCVWKGRVDQFLEHFHAKHPNFVLKENSFKLNCGELLKGNYHENYYLATHEDKNFVMNVLPQPHTSSLQISVSGFHEYKNYKYRLKIECSKSEEKKIDFEWQQVDFFHTKLKSLVEISSEFIEKTFQSCVEVICKLIIINCDSIETLDVSSKATQTSHLFEDPNQSFLALLNEKICCKNLKPPIYVCNTKQSVTQVNHYGGNGLFISQMRCSHFNGHTVCQTCKDKSRFCQTCNKTVDSMYNYVHCAALDWIATTIKYYCTNRLYDCTFFGNINDISDHEKNCKFNPYICPMKKFACQWKGKTINFMKHVQEVHEQKIIRFETLRIPARTVYDEQFFMESHGKIFLLAFNTVKRNGTDFFRWKVAPVGTEEDGSSYSCMIDFLNTKLNGNHRLSINMPCASDACEVHFGIIKGMIGNELVCRIIILKE